MFNIYGWLTSYRLNLWYSITCLAYVLSVCGLYATYIIKVYWNIYFALITSTLL